MKLEETPGPGSYSLEKKLTKGIVFTRSSKEMKKKYSGPGPGRYELGSSIGKGPRPIITSRKSEHSLEKSPGPADYSPKRLNKSLQFTFPRHSEPPYSLFTPGPASYQPKVVTSKSPSAVIGNSIRGLRNFEISPGPGAYNLKKSSVSKIISFSRAPRVLDKFEMTPGPADYSPKFLYKSPKSYTSGKNLKSISTHFKKKTSTQPNSPRSLTLTIHSSMNFPKSLIQKLKPNLNPEPERSKTDRFLENPFKKSKSSNSKTLRTLETLSKFSRKGSSQTSRLSNPLKLLNPKKSFTQKKSNIKKP
jgi:hypothetical protein